MKERNYDRLREALDRLPTYSPPLDNWAKLAEQLSPPLRERLPTYAPPPAVWNAVSKGLDEAPRRGTVRQLLTRRWTAIAAAVALLLGVGAFLLRYDDGPQVTYAYTQEASPTPVVADWDEDEGSFTRARREVTERNEPRLNNLGHELDELTEAREEVKAMLTAYGDDPGMVRQLAEIERERDDVYRRILIEL